jgi:hypothetical protein
VGYACHTPRSSHEPTVDGTSGLHNPSFVLGVLNETLGQDVSN